MKVAVITPYFRESIDVLRRCHDSVLRQTHPCTHIFVSDGHPQPTVGDWQVQHLRLPLAHGDYGNTPRGIGGVSALNQGFDAVAYLDADNWYAEDHVESLVQLCRDTKYLVGFSSRHLVLPSGELCPFQSTEDIQHQHVDTSCFFITKEAGFLVPMWAMMDPHISSVCDRMMFQIVLTRGVSHGWTGRQTLYYETRFPGHFAAMGKPPPADPHVIDWKQIERDFSQERNAARLGFDPFTMYRK